MAALVHRATERCAASVVSRPVCVCVGAAFPARAPLPCSWKSWGKYNPPRPPTRPQDRAEDRVHKAANKYGNHNATADAHAATVDARTATADVRAATAHSNAATADANAATADVRAATAHLNADAHAATAKPAALQPRALMHCNPEP